MALVGAATLTPSPHIPTLPGRKPRGWATTGLGVCCCGWQREEYTGQTKAAMSVVPSEVMRDEASHLSLGTSGCRGFQERAG